MKRVVLLVVACVAIEPSSAFVPSATLPTSLRSVRATSSATLTAVSPTQWDGGAARRRFLQLGACGVLGLANVAPAVAKRARSAPAQLLDEDGNPETQEDRKARIKEERKTADDARKAADAKAKTYEAENGVAKSEIGSTLRGDYYYPTARKRYLPRVRKAYEELEKVEGAPGAGDWGKLEIFAKGPGDAGSALKLYVSALGGGGLSISGNFMSNMKGAAESYDSKFKTFQVALKSKDATKTSSALGDMKTALVAYREAGKAVGLTNDDWGVGNIPNCKRGKKGTGKMSECAVGASFGNNNPNLYSRNVDAIDAD